MVKLSSLLGPALASLSIAGPVGSRRLFKRNDTAIWDYIVVGAGPAGIITATRLAEAGKRTLLLEAGGPSYGITGGTQKPDWLNETDLTRVDVPGLFSSIFDTSTNASELRCPADLVDTFAGCTIGGSSAINAGLYFQPPSSDWDTYFPDGWHSGDVAAAIARLQARQSAVTITSQDEQFYEQSTYALARQWLRDGAGFDEMEDFNADPDRKSRVFGRPAFIFAGGQRSGPVLTYLQSALALPNFRLETKTRALRIVHDKGCASAIEVQQPDGTIMTRPLAAGGRIVVSAGALASPGLLMHSGIGDPAMLQQMKDASRINISPDGWVNNTAIGDGLFDSPNTSIELESLDITSFEYRYADPPADAAALFLSNRSGPYTFSGQTAVFWTYYDAQTALPTEPDAAGQRVSLQGTISTFGHGDFTSPNTMTLNVYGTSGLASRGRVVLDQARAFVPSEPQDLLFAAPQDARVIAAFIADLLAVLPLGLVPRNLDVQATLEDIVAYITTKSTYARGFVNHWCGSCRIGACVDTGAKVIGTSNVHVVDASLLQPLTVNPQMGVMIAAEHAVEKILNTCT